MNPTLRQTVVDRAYARDKAKANAEYGGNFREDIEDYVSPETVDACTDGAIVRPAQWDVTYVAFTDPSGGSKDSMTLAIAHLEGEVAVRSAA